MCFFFVVYLCKICMNCLNIHKMTAWTSEISHLNWRKSVTPYTFTSFFTTTHLLLYWMLFSIKTCPKISIIFVLCLKKVLFNFKTSQLHVLFNISPLNTNPLSLTPLFIEILKRRISLSTCFKGTMENKKGILFELS